MPETLTVDALLPEVKAYLEAIAAEHGEPPPEFDEDAMHDVLTGLLEQPEEGQLFSRPGPAEQYARTKHAKTGQGSLWDESEHPRAADGEFTKGGSGGKETEEEKPKASGLRAKVKSQYKGPDTVASGEREAGFTDSEREAKEAEDAGLHVKKAGKFWVYSDGEDAGKALAEHLQQHGYGKTAEQRKKLSELAGYSSEQIRDFEALINGPDQDGSGDVEQSSGSSDGSDGDDASGRVRPNGRGKTTGGSEQHSDSAGGSKGQEPDDLKPSASKQGSEEKPARAATAETTGETEETENAVTKHGLTFSSEINRDEEHPEHVWGGRISIKGKYGLEAGHAKFSTDPMARAQTSSKWAEGVEQSALKQGIYRIDGIRVSADLKGQGVGGELYLRAYNAVGDRPYFYNSQSSSSAVKAMERLARLGLIELHQNPNNHEQHFSRITEKGQKHLEEMDRQRGESDAT